MPKRNATAIAIPLIPLIALASALALHAQQPPAGQHPDPDMPPAAPAPAQTAPATATAKDHTPSETQPANDAIPPLTLEQCIAMALDKNYDLRIQRITTFSSTNALETAKASYDPSLTGSLNHSYSRSEHTADDDPLAGRLTSGQTTTLNAGVSQKIISGATLQLGYNASRSNPRSAPPQAYGSGLTLSVRQPILKNFGSTVNKAAIERARLGVARSDYDLKSSVLSTVRSVESAYYALAYARANLEVLKSSLDTAQQLLEENTRRREIGVLTDLDVLQAKVGVANAQRSILVGQKSVNDAEDTLLALINPFQFQTPIGPLGFDEPGPIDVNFDRSYKLALDNSPALASMRLAIKQSEIDLAVAKRNRLPQLDVVGSAGYNATRDALGNAAANTLDQHNHNWALGATITYPWGSRAEKASLANVKAALDTNQVTLEKLDQNLLVQVRIAIRAVQTSEEGVRISALAASLSEQQYNQEKARYDQGLSTFRLVQDMKRDLDTARVAELSARVSLRNALADLAQLEGSSLDHYHVKLDETPAN